MRRGDNGGKKGKGLDEEHVRMTQGHGQQGGSRGWGRMGGGGQRGKTGTTVIE